MRSLLFLSVLLLLSGCADLRSGASLRVDIDVYKGPLSKAKEVQLAELQGIVRDAKRNIGQLADAIPDGLQHCDSCGEESCSGGKLGTRKLSIKKKAACFEAGQLKLMKSDAMQIMIELDSIQLIRDKNDTADSSTAYLKQLAGIGNMMKVRATAMSMAFTPYVSINPIYRARRVAFINTYAEYGNQLLSRSGVLFVQYQKNGTDRKKLPLSAFLADSSPTKFPELYRWYDAALPNKDAPKIAERLNIYDSIYSDQYWSRVNSVYASGMGKVNMAMIRDEVGNWSLKSFDSNPQDLMKAYRRLTLAGIKTLTRAVTSSAGAGGVRALVASANDLVSPTKSAPTIALQQQVDLLHQRTMQKLEALKDEFGLTSKTRQDCTSSEMDKLQPCLKNMRTEIKKIMHDEEIAILTLQEAMMHGFKAKKDSVCPDGSIQCKEN